MPLIRRNKNQWRKVYPGVRRTPVYEVVQRMEVGRLIFDNSDSETFKFSNKYDVAPTIACSPKGADANVSIIVTELNAKNVIITASAKFTGEVHLQIVEVPS
jgi:hypothetical protein